MASIDAIRDAGERDINEAMERLDAEHKALLRDALKRYGRVQDIPADVWQRIADATAEELAALYLLLMITADSWALDEMGDDVDDGGAAATALYSLTAARNATTTAASTTSTLRDRLKREIENRKLATDRTGLGTLDDDDIDRALNDAFSQGRRDTISVDGATTSISTGQRGAAGRINDRPGETVTVRLQWITENDNLVCPRCSPLNGTFEETWGEVFPEGPGPDAHPNCRCYLKPVTTANVAESYRESDDEDGEGRWITLDNGTRVKIDKGESLDDAIADLDGGSDERIDKGRKRQTETPAFKKWFGDSKVTTDDGKPLRVYRGQSAVDWNTGEVLDTLERKSEFPAFNRGEAGTKIAAFFTDDPEVASHFAKVGNKEHPENAASFPVYLSIQKPYVIDAGGEPAGKFQFGETGKPFRDAIRSGEYDGIIIRNTQDEGSLFVALKPNQIKSATGNRGTFDPDSDKINESAGR